MPEVKWVANHKLKNEPYPHIPDQVPVLTLDQIEAWLTQERELSINNGEEGYVSMLSLLAQVQAWREGGK